MIIMFPSVCRWFHIALNPSVYLSVLLSPSLAFLYIIFNDNKCPLRSESHSPYAVVLYIYIYLFRYKSLFSFQGKKSAFLFFLCGRWYWSWQCLSSAWCLTHSRWFRLTWCDSYTVNPKIHFSVIFGLEHKFSTIGSQFETMPLLLVVLSFINYGPRQIWLLCWFVLPGMLLVFVSNQLSGFDDKEILYPTSVGRWIVGRISKMLAVYVASV